MIGKWRPKEPAAEPNLLGSNLMPSSHSLRYRKSISILPQKQWGYASQSPLPFFGSVSGHTTELLWVVAGNVLGRLSKPSFWWAEGPGGQEGLQRILLVNTRHMLSTGLSLALKKNSFCFEIIVSCRPGWPQTCWPSPNPRPKIPGCMLEFHTQKKYQLSVTLGSKVKNHRKSKDRSLFV